VTWVASRVEWVDRRPEFPRYPHPLLKQEAAMSWNPLLDT